MGDSLVDIYDENNKALGIQKLKSIAHKDGLWHRAVHIAIYNSEGNILLQLRSKDKDLYPDFWDISAAGHVDAGEEPIVAAIREVEEELGIKLSEEQLEFAKLIRHEATFRGLINKEFYYFYLCQLDLDPKTIKIQQEELQEIKFFTPDELSEELNKSDSKIAPQEYWEELIEKLRSQ